MTSFQTELNRVTQLLTDLHIDFCKVDIERWNDYDKGVVCNIWSQISKEPSQIRKNLALNKAKKGD